MFVFKAAVVGAGTMGGEIAQAIAAADIDVMLKDVDQKFVDVGLEKAREVTRGQLGRLVKKEKITQQDADRQLEETLGRIHGTTSYDGFGDVDFVIEAVPERMELKEAVFAELDDVTPGHAILASNTSSLSVTTIAEATGRPDKVLGFHFFYPASVMPLLEIVLGDETSPETVAAAVNFAQKIRKQPITCADEPGFVVNRILNSSVSEVWRAQEEQGLSIQQVDQQIQGANLAPMGPFFLVDLLGLDTVLHVAEYLNERLGDRFYVHQGMQRLVADKQLGAKTGGSGFYRDGQPQVEGDAAPPEELPELMGVKAVREACLVLEEGIASTRSIDLGMMAGAGMDPRRGILPPLMRCDVEGLDTVLERMERAYADHSDRFEPPAILRRLVAQGRLGQKSGQGFFPWPRPSEGFGDPPVQLELRDGYAIAWLNNPPANSLSPDVIRAIAKVWERVDGDDAIRALIFASANPLLFCAGADIKAFTKMDEAGGRELLELGHGTLRAFERSSTVTIAAVNAIAYGGGCELAMACDVRIAAESALFAQPEVNLGIIPGFGGTQRLPRLVGQSKALEMNLTGDAILADDAYAFGLVSEVVPDHELLDTAVAWARKAGGQAPLAVEQIKRVSAAGDLDEGIEAEKQGFAAVFQSEDAREGISAFLGKRSPRWQGR
ncbi:MAG TPA: 3-hydroxyacyl-CoA dehydrogenase/enoyl-CoA hydratase family protein [Solirubrobacteraceae bacterium]|jgi:enoyl-CoA hydratase/3-hydroxyacyl-CoA dehydrogenase|nr:3-hydroxyacyl-CoA dehydrogenase/enoyl-CoA hydratase family protein [Solirubrobacteraceae bacterium]